jgi:hypothetical protein
MIRRSTCGIMALVMLGMVLGAAAPGKDESVQSGWSASPPKIDGKADDWAGMPFAVWKKGDVQYGFRNDADKLYILLVFRNPKFFSTIAQTGVTLYFGAAGKKDKEYAVHFVRRQVPTQEAIAFIERDRPLTDEEKTQLLAKPAYNIYDARVQNKKVKAGDAAGQSAFPPAHFRFAPDQKTFVYEFMVPLRRDHELAAGVGAAPGGLISVGVEWGGATEDQLKRAVRNADAGIANENTLSSGIERMTSSRGVSLPPKYSFWTTVELAAPGRSGTGEERLTLVGNRLWPRDSEAQTISIQSPYEKKR